MLPFEKNLVKNWEKGLHDILEQIRTNQTLKRLINLSPVTTQLSTLSAVVGRECKLTVEQKALDVPHRLVLILENNSGWKIIRELL